MMTAVERWALALSCVEHATAHIEAMPDCPTVTVDGVPDPDTAQTPAWQLGAALPAHTLRVPALPSNATNQGEPND